MKILITGKTGYIANNLKNFIEEKDSTISADLISLKEKDLSKIEFKNIDAVIHTAALVHQKNKKITYEEYYEVNTKLSYDLALKAKNDGVKKFIFLSTINIYGLEQGIIDFDTQVKPNSFYGKSKLEAENLLSKLNTESFEVLIIRIPLVYGKNCPGNFTELVKISKKLPFFSKPNGYRSFIHISNLSAFIFNSIVNRFKGIYLVKDTFDISSLDIYKTVKRLQKRNIITLPVLKWGLKLIKPNLYNKLFNSLTIDNDYLSKQPKFNQLIHNFDKDKINLLKISIE
jgi:UDP-glucose 4-epimerase